MIPELHVHMYSVKIFVLTRLYSFMVIFRSSLGQEKGK